MRPVADLVDAACENEVLAAFHIMIVSTSGGDDSAFQRFIDAVKMIQDFRRRARIALGCCGPDPAGIQGFRQS
jgi:hypothetical protein